MEFVRLGLGHELRDYVDTWELQRKIHADVVAGIRPNTVLLLEHTDVLTAGRRTNLRDRPVDGTPVVDVDRGGKITWHGPGQLVIYPIVALAEPIDVVRYVRGLEEAVLGLAGELDVATIRVPERSGVWVAGTPNRKIAAIGVRVAKGVTMHGVAVNVNPALESFSNFTPCGIPDVGVTSLLAETGRALTPIDIADGMQAHLTRALEPLLARDRERHEDHVSPTALHAQPTRSPA